MNVEFSTQQIRYELSRITGNPLGSLGIGRLVNYYLKDTDNSGGISLEEFKNATDQYSRLGNPNNISKETFKIIEDDWLNLGKNVQLPVDKKFLQDLVGGISFGDLTPSNRPTIPPDLISLAQESTLPVFSGTRHYASLGIFEKHNLDNGKTIYFFITANHVVDGEESGNLEVRLKDGTTIPLNILNSTGNSDEDRAIGYFVSDDSSIPAVPLSNDYAGEGDQVINAGFPAGVAMDTRAFEHFRTRADSIEYDKKLGVTQITDTTYLTEYSLDKNNPPPLPAGFRYEGPSTTDERNRYLYHTNLSGLPGQSGSPLFRVTNDNNLEIIGIASSSLVGEYDPQTKNVIFRNGDKIPYAPRIELDEANTKPFRVDLESLRFASVNSKINYPNLEKTIQDTIKKENQNSK